MCLYMGKARADDPSVKARVLWSHSRHQVSEVCSWGHNCPIHFPHSSGVLATIQQRAKLMRISYSHDKQWHGTVVIM